MKHTAFFFMTIVALVAISPNAHAQFFKKLKHKVQNVAADVAAEDKAANSSNSTNTNNVSNTNNIINTSNKSQSVEPSAAPAPGVSITNINSFAPSSIYTLLPGETLDFSESCLGTDINNFTPRLGIKNGNDYYLVVNGQKTKISNSIVKCDGPTQADNYVYVPGNLKFSDVSDKDPSLKKYIIDDEYGGKIIKFDHKTYGPFSSVIDFIWNKDHAQFLALAISRYGQDSLLLLRSGDNPKLVAASSTGKIAASDDFKIVRVIYEDNDYKDKVFNPQTGKSATPPNKYDFIYKPSGDFVRIDNDNNSFYINGKLVKAFPRDNYSRLMRVKDLFISPEDNSKWAANNGEELFFSDGRVAGSVISPRMVYKDGAYQMYWLTLSPDNKTVVLCHAKI